MKKLRYLLLTTLCFALIFSMCSCQFIKGIFGDKEEEIVITDAKSLLEAIEKQTGKAEQFRIEGETEAILTVAGQTIEVTGESTFITTNPDGESPYYYSETETSTKVGNTTQKQTNVVAYYNGNAYMSNTQYESYMYAPMTADEFVEFLDAGASFPEILSATKQEYEQKDDGSWELELSDYTKKALDSLMEELDPDGTFGELVEITDIEWKIEADSKFRVQKVRVKFELDEEKSGEDDKFTISYKNAKYEDVATITDDLTDGTYQNVADLKIIRTLEKHVADLKKSTDGAFTVHTTATSTVGTSKNTAEGTDKVQFGEKNGSFFFKLEETADGRTIKMNYENGTCVTTGNGYPVEETISEKDAKAVIYHLLDNGLHFDVDRISVITEEETDEGTVYTLSAVKPSAAMEARFTKCGESVQRIAVTVSDGKIVKIVNTEISNGTINSTALQIKVESTVTFS